MCRAKRFTGVARYFLSEMAHSPHPQLLVKMPAYQDTEKTRNPSLDNYIFVNLDLLTASGGVALRLSHQKRRLPQLWALFWGEGLKLTNSTSKLIISKLPQQNNKMYCTCSLTSPKTSTVPPRRHRVATRRASALHLSVSITSVQ